MISILILIRGYPPWILAVSTITYHDAPDIGQATALTWNGGDWVTLLGTVVTWLPPASTENRRYYIQIELIFPELMALAFGQNPHIRCAARSVMDKQ